MEHVEHLDLEYNENAECNFRDKIGREHDTASQREERQRNNGTNEVGTALPDTTRPPIREGILQRCSTEGMEFAGLVTTRLGSRTKQERKG